MGGDVRETPSRVTDPIYLDYQATTPVAPEVAAAMEPWIQANFANPHSPSAMARKAAAAIDMAREEVRRIAEGRIHPPHAARATGLIYFTSGATEAANWALKGAAARLPPGRRRIVTLATEHACVLDTVGWLATQGFEVEVLPVGRDGLVDLDLLAERVDERTGLVAAMAVNNEIGVQQEIHRIGLIAREKGALLFCDAAQGLGRVGRAQDGCDLMSLSSHKIHGPKGIGALWIRRGVEIDPLLHGGGQEGGLRSGTLSPALCVGFGAAARLFTDRRRDEGERVGWAWDDAHVRALWDFSVERLAGWTVNGSMDQRYRGNLNLRRDGIDAARLISEVREVAFSAGSACASGSGRPSHVLSAIGLSDREARSSIRLGFGRYTSEEALSRALDLIDEAANRQLAFGE
jgi:cysteine desulfurase